ncbi:hypothetical protein NCS56_01048600 [Fusarium sp. Ph1]|nr:hypothetical protein NCS56_01048600 [Fusarium sp. Ph1]
MVSPEVDSSASDPCIASDYADSDVAGIGVLISFALSSLLTIVAILAAYVAYALRPDRYSSLDKAIVAGFGRRSTISEGTRRHRIVTFESFIKSLSDQQLFTSLALTVAIYLLRYGVTGLDLKVSAYSYCMAVNIALLSCVVHLSAMTILRDHFETFTWIRNIRVVLMLVTISTLLPQLVFTQTTDTAVTLRCAVTSTDVRLSLGWTDKAYDRTVFLATFAIMLVIICSYLRRLLELYSPSFRESPERWVANVFHAITQWPSTNDQDRFNQEAAVYNERQRLELPTYAGMMLHIQVLYIVSSECRRSFIVEIIWLLFYTTFALCQIFFYVFWGTSAGVSHVNFSLGFGQILPLVLLGLPFLSALELYSEWANYNSEIERSMELRDIRTRPNTSQCLVADSSALPINTQDGNLGLYDLCFQHQRRTALVYTWLYSLTVVVIIGAIVFSGAIWSANAKEDDKVYVSVGHSLTLTFFCGLLFSLTFSAISWVLWVGRGRFMRPLTR